MKHNQLRDLLATTFQAHTTNGQAAYASVLSQLGTSPVTDTGLTERQVFAGAYNAMLGQFAKVKGDKSQIPTTVLGAGQVWCMDNGYGLWIHEDVYKALGRTKPLSKTTPIAPPIAAMAPSPAQTQVATPVVVAQTPAPAVKLSAPIVNPPAPGNRTVQIRLDDLATLYSVLRDAVTGFEILVSGLSDQDKLTIGYTSPVTPTGDTLVTPAPGSAPMTQGLVPNPMTPATIQAQGSDGKVLVTNAAGISRWVTPAQAAAQSPEAMAKARAARLAKDNAAGAQALAPMAPNGAVPAPASQPTFIDTSDLGTPATSNGHATPALSLDNLSKEDMIKMLVGALSR